MRFLASLLLAVLLTTSAFAGLDPDTDSMGIYFDIAGNSNCSEAAPFMPVAAYLILMNPAAPTNGFECSVSMTGAPHFILSTIYHGSTACDGVLCGPYDFAIGWPASSPVPANGALLLVSWSLMLQSPGELLFRIGPCPIPSLPGGLPVVTGNGILRQCGVASGDLSLPVGGINAATCWFVGDELSTFGAVKGLFR